MPENSVALFEIKLAVVCHSSPRRDMARTTRLTTPEARCSTWNTANPTGRVMLTILVRHAISAHFGPRIAHLHCDKSLYEALWAGRSLVTAVVPQVSETTGRSSEVPESTLLHLFEEQSFKRTRERQKTGWYATFYFPGTFLVGCRPTSKTRSCDSGTGAGEFQEKSRIRSWTCATWLLPISSASAPFPNCAEP